MAGHGCVHKYVLTQTLQGRILLYTEAATDNTSASLVTMQH